MSDSMRNFLEWMAGTPLRILIILIAAGFIQTFGSRAITRAMNKLASADLVLGPRNIVARQKERASTIGGVLTATLKSATWIIAIAMALGEFGFDLGPLIASAGIVGVAVGLGAQTLVRDILSGIFMLIEDQYGVGDSVNVLEIEGVVEKVGLRVTTVRDGQGTLWYLRNGEILKVGNQSQSG
jgi:small-conductance mechanosensitive channel